MLFQNYHAFPKRVKAPIGPMGPMVSKKYSLVNSVLRLPREGCMVTEKKTPFLVSSVLRLSREGCMVTKKLYFLAGFDLRLSGQGCMVTEKTFLGKILIEIIQGRLYGDQKRIFSIKFQLKLRAQRVN